MLFVSIVKWLGARPFLVGFVSRDLSLIGRFVVSWWLFPFLTALRLASERLEMLGCVVLSGINELDLR